jgi:hypothetical protein
MWSGGIEESFREGKVGMMVPDCVTVVVLSGGEERGIG